MRLGILGGTFDPPHVGHLIVAQDAWAKLGLDRVVFVPASSPPHKEGRVHAPAGLRLEMVRAATSGDARFEVDALELRRAGPSFTVDTLRELRERAPEAALLLLLGVDQFRTFGEWREPEEIARLAELVVLSRAGQRHDSAPTDAPHRGLSVPRIDVSSTEIRRRVASGQPIRYLVPHEVEAIIEREGLYREPSAHGGAGARSVDPAESRSMGTPAGPSPRAQGTIDDSRS